ncbi:UNVERIFIED_ORG: hypothetical protein ABIB63_000521 [Xanthomonas axonopodis]
MCPGAGLATDHGIGVVRPQSRTRANPPVQEPLRLHTQDLTDIGRLLVAACGIVARGFQDSSALAG